MLLQRDPPVDWKRLILDLRRWGWTLKGIADAINVSDSTVQHWLDYGKEPMYENGRALIKLHAQQEKCFSNPAMGTAALQPAR